MYRVVPKEIFTRDSIILAKQEVEKERKINYAQSNCTKGSVDFQDRRKVVDIR